MARQPDQTPSPVVEAIRSMTDSTYRQHSDVLYAIHEVSRLVSTLSDRGLGAHGITHTQWWGLMHIYEHEGATQTELAEIFHMGRAAAGKLLERLEAKNWVERRSDAGDSRVRRVYLRHEVVPVFRHMTDQGWRLFRSLLDGLSDGDEQVMLAGLRRIKANAER
ncbi:MarR family transcriptional regulator [Devosia ginsengisoli]|uniref:MarR family transcriptional regulator n=2 Tax=Devosia ginsengisoli TaxID=400770 RepID=A0A5B8LWV0_9HYPH|nr:MarR family transcriptional regulator [Devosia ginsengisoli]